MHKMLLVAFNGDAMCFVHVLLNALDMHKRGDTARIILEGKSTELLTAIQQKKFPFQALYEQAKAAGLVAGVCRACAAKMNALDAAEAEKLPLLDDMQGHPSLVNYLDQGYQIITF